MERSRRAVTSRVHALPATTHSHWHVGEVGKVAVSPLNVRDDQWGLGKMFAMSEHLEMSEFSSSVYFSSQFWSERVYIYHSGLAEMHTSIREDFGGVGMGYYRDKLIKWLDCVRPRAVTGSEQRIPQAV